MKRLLAVLLAMAMMAGCVSFAEEADAVRIPCYGTPAQTAALATFVNGTDQAIHQLRIRSSRDEEQVSPDLLGGDVIPVGAKFGLWLEANPADEAYCDVLLGFADGQQMTLHQVAAADFDEALICRDINVAYLSYTSVVTGEAISTWLAELSILELIEADDSPLPDDSEREQTQSGEFGS